MHRKVDPDSEVPLRISGLGPTVLSLNGFSHVSQGKAGMNRDKRLQDFLETLEEAFVRTAVPSEGGAMLGKMFTALRLPAPTGMESPHRLPVCHYLDDAFAACRSTTPSIARLADAFTLLEPMLSWKTRHSTGPFASDNFWDGHANTVIVGEDGIEERDDVMIGASLLAPHVRYPDHHHPPEEVYLVLSPGRFRHGGSDWFEPGLEGPFTTNRISITQWHRVMLRCSLSGAWRTGQGAD